MTRIKLTMSLLAMLLAPIACSAPEPEVELVGTPSPRRTIASAEVGGKSFSLEAWTRRARKHEMQGRSDICFVLLEDGKEFGGKCGFLDFPKAAGGHFNLFRTTSRFGSEEVIGGFAPPFVESIRLKRVSGGEVILKPSEISLDSMKFFFAVFAPGEETEGWPVPLDEHGKVVPRGQLIG